MIQTNNIPVPPLIDQSNRLHAAWMDAIFSWPNDDSRDWALCEMLSVHACNLTLAHGNAIRHLIASGLESSALALLRAAHCGLPGSAATSPRASRLK